jgi:hypothetical protein
MPPAGPRAPGWSRPAYGFPAVLGWGSGVPVPPFSAGSGERGGIPPGSGKGRVMTSAGGDCKCAPVRVRSTGPKPARRFVTSDRRRRHRTLAATRGRMPAQVRDSRPHQPGAARPNEQHPHRHRHTSAARDQRRPGLTGKASRSSRRELRLARRRAACPGQGGRRCRDGQAGHAARESAPAQPRPASVRPTDMPVPAPPRAPAGQPPAAPADHPLQ